MTIFSTGEAVYLLYVERKDPKGGYDREMHRYRNTEIEIKIEIETRIEKEIKIEMARGTDREI